MSDSQQKNQWAKMVARCWADEDFKQRFIDDPVTIAESYGVEEILGRPIGDFAGQIRVVEDPDAIPGQWSRLGTGSHEKFLIHIPPKPESFDQLLSDSELAGAAGGSSTSSKSHHSIPTCVSPPNCDASDASDACDACEVCCCSTCGIDDDTP